MIIRLESTSAIRPSTYNPRVADERRLALIELSLRKLGWLLPIVADANGEILSGHQRHYVATERLGQRQVPVARTDPMALPERKAINIMFNRGTNDFARSETSTEASAALLETDLSFVEDLPDLEGDARFPCLRTQRRRVAELTAHNSGRWNRYARNMARSLNRAGVTMPVVITPGGGVINGIGRLEFAAERSIDEVAAVVVTDPVRAEAARLLLNRLTMDFNIHERYRDDLRHNSFRRPVHTRTYLGRGLVFMLTGAKAAYTVNLSKKAHRDAWKKVYGTRVVDFGAGHLHETEILRSIGVEVSALEPYHVASAERAGKLTDKVNVEASRALCDRFLDEVADGRPYHSIFLSSVLNSVPFLEDRRHIVQICHALALATDGTEREARLYACCRATSDAAWRHVSGGNTINERQSTSSEFHLGYEPGILLGDVRKDPKVQKYHTAEELYHLLGRCFQTVQAQYSGSNVEAVAAAPKALTTEQIRRLRAALAFEFDLPYPGGQRMGLAEKAFRAFSRRLSIDL